MIIYNVTIKLHSSIASQWLSWLLEQHIPDVMQSGCFVGHQVLHLLEVDDSEGPTYAIQYKAKTMEDYQRYINDFAPAMRQKSIDEWGDLFIAFRTVMEVVQ